jgi:hypothetical protein
MPAVGRGVGACAHLVQTFELCAFSDIRIFWKASKTFGARKLVRSHKKSLRLSSLFSGLWVEPALILLPKKRRPKSSALLPRFCHTEAGSGCRKYVLVRTYVWAFHISGAHSGCATPTVEVCAGKVLVASTYIEQWLSSFAIWSFLGTFYNFVRVLIKMD